MDDQLLKRIAIADMKRLASIQGTFFLNVHEEPLNLSPYFLPWTVQVRKKQGRHNGFWQRLIKSTTLNNKWKCIRHVGKHDKCYCTRLSARSHLTILAWISAKRLYPDTGITMAIFQLQLRFQNIPLCLQQTSSFSFSRMFLKERFDKSTII